MWNTLKRLEVPDPSNELLGHWERLRMQNGSIARGPMMWETPGEASLLQDLLRNSCPFFSDDSVRRSSAWGGARRGKGSTTVSAITTRNPIALRRELIFQLDSANRESTPCSTVQNT